jgi:hypothetical protein
MRIRLVKPRSLLITLAIAAVAICIHRAALQSHRRDVEILSSIGEVPLEYNLPTVRRLGCPPHGEDSGRAYFDYRGWDVLTSIFRTLDIRCGCRVTRLSLSGPSWSDRSLPRLAELTELHELRLRNTRVTSDAIGRLNKELPHLRIMYNSEQ